MVPEPNDLDASVYRVVTEELAPYGDAAVVERVWSEGGSMWFTEVKPKNPAAAPIKVAAQDDDTLNVTVGNIWFEMFGQLPQNLPRLREIAAAVFAGKVEEVGDFNAYGRIYTESGPIRVGRMHLPWPWRSRRTRKYGAYAQ